MARLKTRDRVLLFVRSYIETIHVPPTRREIAKGCGLAHSNVQYHLEALDRTGSISLMPNKARGIRLNQGRELLNGKT